MTIMAAEGVDGRTLERWFSDQKASLDDPAARFTVDAVLASGVAREDVDALVDVLALPSVKVGARVMRSHLLLLHRFSPDLGLRSATGWVFVAAAAQQPVLDVAGPWLDAGLGEDGWLFAAAGLSVDEGRAVRATNDADRRDAVRVLAALAGVPVPHG